MMHYRYSTRYTLSSCKDKPVSTVFFFFFLNFRSATLNTMSLCAQGVSDGVVPPQKLENFVFLKTESWNLVNDFRYKFNETMKTKFQFYGLNRPKQIAHYGRILLGAQMITQAIPLHQFREYIPIHLHL